MPRRTSTWMSLWAALAVCGCAARGNVDLLEARLRQQEDSVHELQTQLAEADRELAVAQRDADDLRAQLTRQGEKALAAEQADVLYRVSGVRFNSLLTGTLHRGAAAGGDYLTAVLVPHDEDGELLKLPGQVELNILDASQTENQQQVGRWAFTPEQSREMWRSGFFSSGYQFQLPWKDLPRDRDLLLHARLTTADGRQFEATELVHVGDTDKIARQPRSLPAASTQAQAIVPATEEEAGFARVGGVKDPIPYFAPETPSAAAQEN